MLAAGAALLLLVCAASLRYSTAPKKLLSGGVSIEEPRAEECDICGGHGHVLWHAQAREIAGPTSAAPANTSAAAAAM
uniref:Secreted protein n=1 Tax=Oryza nivara TaxID=4536 RepID=A0A0E0FWR1_ORYNI